jgi:hypothetical protein
MRRGSVIKSRKILCLVFLSFCIKIRSKLGQGEVKKMAKDD